MTLTEAETKNTVSIRVPSKPFEATRKLSVRVSSKPVETERMASAPFTARAASSICCAAFRRCSGVTVGYAGSSSCRSTEARPS